MRRPFSVQVFLTVRGESGLSYLLLQRNERPDLALPDFWQGVTGALDVGETYEQAAIREVEEETCIAIPGARPSGFEHRFPIRQEWRASYGGYSSEVTELVFYSVLPNAVAPVLSVEHKAYRWCSYEQAVSLLSFGRNAECLQSVQRELENARASLKKHLPSS